MIKSNTESPRVLIEDLKKYINKEAYVKGSLFNLRNLGKLCFLILKDRSGVLQIVIEKPEIIKNIKSLQFGSIIYAKGTIKTTDTVKEGLEMTLPEIMVINPVSEPMPLELIRPDINASLENILDYRPLTLRHIKAQAIFKIQAEIVHAYREFMRNEGSVEFFGPTIISASSEGGAEMFKVNYFEHEAILSQSAQLYKQMMVGVYEKVFALMKCYRAEKSATRRHLTESTQFEFETGFVESFEEIMDILERTVKYIQNHIKTACMKEIQILGIELAKAPEKIPFPRVDFKDALEIVYKRTGIDERSEKDLSPMAEKELCKYAREKFGTDFIFIPHFLKSKTAFYAKPNPENPLTANYFDLLGRDMELASGGQRIDNYQELVESLKLKDLNPENFQDYLSIFKHGMPPHGGFGMGMERLTMILIGLENIREASLFPSDMKRIAGIPLAPKIFMGEDLYKKIIKGLQDSNIEYELIEHEEVNTSEEASKIRGTKLSEGVKAMVLRGKRTGKNVMLCLPADQKVSKEILEVIQEKQGEHFEFEKPVTIKKRYGIEVGAVPPYGNLMAMTTYFTQGIAKELRIAFNCGYKTKSIIMGSKELLEQVNPEII